METISASTVLVSYNWPKNTVRYERTAKFIDAFFSKIYEFDKAPRSPLWKSVNVAASLPGWPRFPAAEEWLVNWRAGQAKGQEEDFRKFMSEQGARLSGAQIDVLFRDFEKWKAAH